MYKFRKSLLMIIMHFKQLKKAILEGTSYLDNSIKITFHNHVRLNVINSLIKFDNDKFF